jgi:hypothetical protein
LRAAFSVAIWLLLINKDMNILLAKALERVVLIHNVQVTWNKVDEIPWLAGKLMNKCGEMMQVFGKNHETRNSGEKSKAARRGEFLFQGRVDSTTSSTI